MVLRRLAVDLDEASPEGAEAYSLGREPQVPRGSHPQKAPKGRQQTGRSTQQVFLVEGDTVLFEQPHQLVLE